MEPGFEALEAVECPRTRFRARFAARALSLRFAALIIYAMV